MPAPAVAPAPTQTPAPAQPSMAYPGMQAYDSMMGTRTPPLRLQALPPVLLSVNVTGRIIVENH